MGKYHWDSFYDIDTVVVFMVSDANTFAQGKINSQNSAGNLTTHVLHCFIANCMHNKVCYVCILMHN